MRVYFLLFIILMTGRLASVHAQAVPESPDMIIKNARLIDGTGAVIEGTVIAIRDGRILSIKQVSEEDMSWYEDGRMWDWGNNRNISWKEEKGFRVATATVTVIDAAGRTVLPGLIDTHVHLLDCATITDDSTLNRYLKWGLPEKLDAYLAHGVTTIKSMGDPEDAILLVRERIRKQELLGPRLFVVGPTLTLPGVGGFTAAALFRLNEWPRVYASKELDGRDNALATVRRLASRGVDAIHLDLCSLDLTSYSLLATSYYQDMLRAIIDEAHGNGIPVTAYTVDERVALCAINLGVDGVEHGVTRSLLRGKTLENRLGLQRVVYAPALGVYATLLPEHLGKAIDNLRNLAEGEMVEIVLGSDTFGEAPPGLSTIQEIELMTRAGLTPAQVIRAATRDAAEHLGRLNELGTVEPGKYADLIMVRGDPLKDIAALKDITLVIKDGRIVADKRESMKREDMR